MLQQHTIILSLTYLYHLLKFYLAIWQFWPQMCCIMLVFRQISNSCISRQCEYSNLETKNSLQTLLLWLMLHYFLHLYMQLLLSQKYRQFFWQNYLFTRNIYKFSHLAICRYFVFGHKCSILTSQDATIFFLIYKYIFLTIVCKNILSNLSLIKAFIQIYMFNDKSDGMPYTTARTIKWKIMHAVNILLSE